MKEEREIYMEIERRSGQSTDFKSVMSTTRLNYKKKKGNSTHNNSYSHINIQYTYIQKGYSSRILS